MSWRNILDQYLYSFLNELGRIFNWSLDTINLINDTIYQIAAADFTNVTGNIVAMLLGVWAKLHWILGSFHDDYFAFVDWLYANVFGDISPGYKTWTWVLDRANDLVNFLTVIGHNIQAYVQVFIDALTATWVADWTRITYLTNAAVLWLADFYQRTYYWIWQTLGTSVSDLIHTFTDPLNGVLQLWNNFQSNFTAIISDPAGFVTPLATAAVNAALGPYTANLAILANWISAGANIITAFIDDPAGYVLAAVYDRFIDWLAARVSDAW